MKLVKFILFFLMVIEIATGSAFAQERTIEERQNNIKSNTLTSYFEALKKGDVERIKQLLPEEEYKAYQVLLEQNAGYPDFLKRHYQGVNFRIKKFTKEGENFHYQVEVIFPNGNREMSKLVLKED